MKVTSGVEMEVLARDLQFGDVMQPLMRFEPGGYVHEVTVLEKYLDGEDVVSVVYWHPEAGRRTPLLRADGKVKVLRLVERELTPDEQAERDYEERMDPGNRTGWER